MKEVPQDHGREHERRGKDRDAESDDEFDFGSLGEGEGESADKGNKTEDGLETTNSDERENRSEEAESVMVFDLMTPNQPKAMRRKRQRKSRR